jgi:hypothetical protein
MPESSIDIYVDTSFFDFDSTYSGSENVTAVYKTVDAGNIGQRDTPVDYVVPSVTSGVADSPVEFFLTYSGMLNEAYLNMSNKYEVSTAISGVEVALLSYSIPTTTSGLSRADDTELKYFTGVAPISGFLDTNIGFIGGQLYPFSEDIYTNYWLFLEDTVYYDYDGFYTAGGHYDPLIPGPPENQVIISGTDDYAQYFTMGSLLTDGTVQAYLEIFLSGYPFMFKPEDYTYRFHSVAGLESDKQGPLFEAAVISGGMSYTPFDVYSTTTGSGYYNVDTVCGLVDLASYAFDLETITGTIGYYFSDVVCGTVGTTGYGFDIDLLSLKISNFSLDIDEYTEASGTICVDITDDIYNVVTSGTYFIIDSTVTSGNVFTPITDGYRMCYDSPNDFEDILGSTTFTVHASNDNGDVLERDYYLTAGYFVEYENREQDYGLGTTVAVRGFAENLASCPSSDASAYAFETVPRRSSDLGVSIVGVPYSEGNLSAEITPTTDTIYFYGKVFRVEVRAKDFAGNEMEPFEFEFKIEDAPD